MKKSVCHYSFHRTWTAEKWTCERLAEEVKILGVEGIDFHAGLLGAVEEAPGKIRAALGKTGLTLSGLSMSNNFNQSDPALLKNQIDTVKRWLQVAAEVKAPVSRIFGGHIQDRSNPVELRQGFDRIIAALGELVQEAEKLGVILALENHGGLPCTGEEQVEVIKKINSKYLRATIDVGNYLQGGQEGHVGTTIAAPFAAYVHFKDFRKKPASKTGSRWDLESCTVGQGDIQHRQCLEVLKKAGYNGFIALEYEGADDEKIGIPQSLAYMNTIMLNL
ncbi:MAG: sugar phosphate isomerase/epimerase [Verrucomicrobia bacterium]|nr:sugar phosphate isomerase/epimerase [Verrucomicrobiota bacterium]MBU4290876.1 sugar phosphate isomerase/epimerase [Verrucomicrobiota bacterium]MBU4429691.1 sugar phosphate isomerase/epimerase [Verrucomicrobiota bacterium]MBU4497816.1 sugar phosphate isomerase/epimerase [Verrucomicrobiota bacterium]MCG2680625.1 sugar phosphate isomerase/epimerase [Kiritimatiellia bacterium]